METLEAQFTRLLHDVDRLSGLLEEANERHYLVYLARARKLIEEHKLAGATYVLGCFGGQDTLSDLVVARDIEGSDPLRFDNLNKRLTRLRTDTFESANAIAARRAW